MTTPDPDLSHLLVELPVPPDGPDRVRRRARRRQRVRAAAGAGTALATVAALAAVVLLPADDAGRQVRTAVAPTVAGAPSVPGGTDVEVVAGGAGAFVTVDVDAGRGRPLALPVPGGPAAVDAVIPRVDGYAVVVGPDVYFVDHAGHAPPVHLGRGTAAFPSLVPDRVWIVDGRTVVEVDATGSVTTLPEVIPCCRAALADVEGGILTATRSGSLQVWSLKHEVVRRVLATDARLVAVAPRGDLVAAVDDSCGAAGGQLSLVDVRTGEARQVTGLDCVAAAPGAFYEDAGWLAVHLPGGGVGVVEEFAAAGTVVPRVRVDHDAPLAWSGNSPWLVFADDTDPDGTPLRAMRVRDGSFATVVVPVSFGWAETTAIVPLDWLYMGVDSYG